MSMHSTLLNKQEEVNNCSRIVEAFDHWEDARPAEADHYVVTK